MRTAIEMAREVKATAYTNRHYPDRTTYTFGPEQLKAFEALVRADEREEFQRWFDAVTAQHKQLILAEREVCAKVCEAVHVGAYDTPEFWREGVAYTCAAAIRARGNT
jgi:hypothetical protein